MVNQLESNLKVVVATSRDLSVLKRHGFLLDREVHGIERSLDDVHEGTRRQLERPFWEVEYHIARINDEVYGSVMLQTEFEPAGLCHNGWIRTLYVDGDVRSRGTGTALMESVERRARGGGVRALKLVRSDANVYAAQLDRFYSRLGYKKHGIVYKKTL